MADDTKKKAVSDIHEKIARIQQEMEDTISTFEQKHDRIIYIDEDVTVGRKEQSVAYPDSNYVGPHTFRESSFSEEPNEAESSVKTEPKPMEDFPGSTRPPIVEAIHAEIDKVVVGYDDVIDDLLIVLLSGGHVILEGYPGIAKTTLAKAFTHVLGISYNRIQFTPDMLPQDVTGHYFFNQKDVKFEVRKGPIFTNLLLADEINRGTPKVQSAFLEAMQEKQVTIEGTTFPIPSPFMVIATVNPLETEGVYAIPIAQADRFSFKIIMGYVDEAQELDVLRLKASEPIERMNRLNVIDTSELFEAFKDVYVDDDILSYIHGILKATRNSPLLSIGASPRAGVHLLNAAKAKACIEGRSYVIPDDVQYVAWRALPHRLVPSPETSTEDISMTKVIDTLLSSVSVPLKE